MRTLRFLMVLALASGCGASLPPLPPAGPPVSDEAPVVVYGSRSCRHTSAARDYLRARNLPVRFREVDGDIDASDEMHARANAAHVTLTGIPMLVVRGRVVVGFNPDAIERALRD